MSEKNPAVVYVNGFNLGRFLKRGPQYTIYLPGCFLKDENEIVVLELENTNKKALQKEGEVLFCFWIWLFNVSASQ